MGMNAGRVRMDKEIHTLAEVLRTGNKQCPSVEAGLELLDCKDLGLQSEDDWEFVGIVLEVCLYFQSSKEENADFQLNLVTSLIKFT